jgi:hypothetical protein
MIEAVLVSFVAVVVVASSKVATGGMCQRGFRGGNHFITITWRIVPYVSRQHQELMVDHFF